MGQAANCRYVCNVINAYANKNFQPVTGTETQAANVEYLLKMVDKASTVNNHYGTSSRATKQIIDTVAVTNALRLIVLFETKTYTTSGVYSLELPPGTYKMTAVSGMGGNGGQGYGRNPNGSGAGYSGTVGSGTSLKAEITFSISTTTTVSVTVGSNGGNGMNGVPESGSYPSITSGKGGSGGTAGTYGNGNNGINGDSTSSGITGGGGGGGAGGGASGINGKYYVSGGGGGGGASTTGWSGQSTIAPNADNNAQLNIGGTGGNAPRDGAKGGNGGSLTGTVLSGMATTESPCVKIELA